MTEEEFLSLPDREKDALVAEKVMCVPKYGIDTVKLSGSDIFPKPYSTDIAAAWEVGQAIVDMDDDNEFEIHLSPTRYEECTVMFRYGKMTDNPSDPTLWGPYFVTLKTAPLAICLAALKAKGVVE